MAWDEFWFLLHILILGRRGKLSRGKLKKGPYPYPYILANGAGNQFAILDGRGRYISNELIEAAKENLKRLNYDQFILLLPVVKADIEMRIFNADGGEVSACGNATRVVAKLLMDESTKIQVRIATKAGILSAVREEDGSVRVNMGRPRFKHADIPMDADTDRVHVPLVYSDLRDGHAVGMGNPHVVFFVDDVDAVKLEAIGPQIEHRTDMFPERVNVSIAQPVGGDTIKVRTWERGAGLTQACGTAACAVAVAANERGLAGRNVQIHMPGGILPVEWDKDDNVWLSGPVEETGRGEIKL